MIILGSILLYSSLTAADLKVDFLDKKWDGVNIPRDEVCSNYNIEAGSTPSLRISNIPSNGSKIIFTYNDKTFKQMDNGGHGIISYDIPKNSTTIEIPSLIGESFELKDGFKIVQAHTGIRFNKTAGAYLAPCSGGKNNTYSVNINIVDYTNKSIAVTELILGKF